MCWFTADTTAITTATMINCVIATRIGVIIITHHIVVTVVVVNAAAIIVDWDWRWRCGMEIP